jgi:hypothetical protein
MPAVLVCMYVDSLLEQQRDAWQVLYIPNKATRECIAIVLLVTCSMKFFVAPVIAFYIYQTVFIVSTL